MRLLLTGASGFFGSNLLDLVGEPRRPGAGDGPSLADFEIHTVQRTASPNPAVTSHQVDLFDSGATADLVEQIRPTHLCHLAWLGPETQDRYRSPDNHRWVEASKRLFDAFGSSGGQRLVHLGSCIEYGNAASGPRIETQALDPDTAYGTAKAELSQYLDELSTQLSVAVARPFFCYGPHEQPDRLVPSLILALTEGRSIDLTEGRQRRDYLDARDIAAAIVTLLLGDAVGPFNIGSGQAVEVRSIAEQLGRITNRPELLNFGGRPEGADSAAEIVADIGRITSATEWRPSISLERGLEQATQWWLQHVGDRPASGGGNER